jgi:hypothetical protein
LPVVEKGGQNVVVKSVGFAVVKYVVNVNVKNDVLVDEVVDVNAVLNVTLVVIVVVVVVVLPFNLFHINL